MMERTSVHGNPGRTIGSFESPPMIDCLIAGAGPVGLTLANLFCRYGIDFRIIDRKPGPTSGPRAVALWSRTVEVLDHLGLSEQVSEHSFQAQRAHLYSGVETLAKVEFGNLPSRHNYLTLMAQEQTERMLVESLRRQGKEVEWGKALHGWTGNDASLRPSDGSQIERQKFRYLFGCDGANSQVRRSGHIGFHGSDAGGSWVTAEARVRGVRFDAQEPSFYISDQGPVTFFPLGEERFQVVTQLSEGDSRPVDSINFQQFQEIVEARVPGPFEMETLGEVTTFEAKQKQVDHLRYSSVMLLGDAAHVHSPAYGQGINIGIQDAFNVAWKVAQVIRWKSTEKLLESISPERHSVAASALRLGTLTEYALKVKNPTLKWIRDMVVETACGFDVVQKQLLGVLSESRLSYSDSILNCGPPSGPFKPGDRIPHVSWFDEEHRTRTLLGLMDDLRWTLIQFDNEAPRLGELGSRERIKVIQVDLRAVTVDGVLVGPGKPLLKAFEGHTDRYLLVRPDGYLAATFAKDDHIEMGNFLRPFIA